MNQQNVGETNVSSLSSIESMRAMLERLDKELTRLESLFDERANRDDLTGVLRRKAFEERCEVLRARCRQNGAPFGVIIIDLDHFKRLNDAFGHQTGDEALRAVGELLRSYESKNRFVCRYGGEEFAIALQGDALALAEELRLRIEQLRFSGKRLSCTASIGVQQDENPEHSFEELLKGADGALYRAKNLGRNRVEAA